MEPVPIQNCRVRTGLEVLWLTGFLAVQVYCRSGSHSVRWMMTVEPSCDSEAWVSCRVQLYRTLVHALSTEQIKVMLQEPLSDMFTDFMMT